MIKSFFKLQANCSSLLMGNGIWSCWVKKHELGLAEPIHHYRPSSTSKPMSSPLLQFLSLSGSIFCGTSQLPLLIHVEHFTCHSIHCLYSLLPFSLSLVKISFISFIHKLLMLRMCSSISVTDTSLDIPFVSLILEGNIPVSRPFLFPFFLSLYRNQRKEKRS